MCAKGADIGAEFDNPAAVLHVLQNRINYLPND